MLLQLSKTIHFPNKINLARFHRSPELGPKVLFFSGGNALRSICSELVKYTHNSIHIVTPFDSGGSSAALRKAFNMPAIGDIRNRLLALADKSLKGYPEIFQLFDYRLSKKKAQSALQKELDQMIKGHHELVQPIPDPMRKIIRQHLEYFNQKKTVDFDLKKASIGNLVLTAGYLQNRRNFDVIIYIFSSLVGVRGIVRPVVNKDLDLAVELEDGTQLVSQHLFSGKEAEPITSPIKYMGLSKDSNQFTPIQVPIREKMRNLIKQAELICYPMGSYYSSILANLLPRGVGKAIKSNPCPKIMIPNTSHDPETFEMTLENQIDRQVEYLRKDDPENIAPSDVLNFILLDEDNSTYQGKFRASKYKKLGIEVIRCPLMTKSSKPLIDEKLFIESVLSFA